MLAAKLADVPEGSEVAGVSYEPDRLVVSLGIGPAIVFEDVLGFRVLDEGDLLEFWPACSLGFGLFRIEDGGWLAQESQRQGFLSAHRAGLMEFFVTGPNSCVSVLGFREPKVEDNAS